MTGDYLNILRECRTIAVVGMSADPSRPSHQVANYLRSHGYKIYPVNPKLRQVLEERCYPDLASLPERVDVVQIFRRPEEVTPIVEEAIRIGARVVWMQEGVVNPEAAALAEEAGLEVVMDRCMKKEHLRIHG